MALQVFSKHVHSLVMRTALHVFGLLDPQEYVRAFQSSLWPSVSSAFLFFFRVWFTYCFPPILTTALGSLVIHQLLLIVFNKQAQGRSSSLQAALSQVK